MIFLAHSTYSEDNTGRHMVLIPSNQTTVHKGFLHLLHQCDSWWVVNTVQNFLEWWQFEAAVDKYIVIHHTRVTWLPPRATALMVTSEARVQEKAQARRSWSHVMESSVVGDLEGYWLLYIMLQNRSFFLISWGTAVCFLAVCSHQ